MNLSEYKAKEIELKADYNSKLKQLQDNYIKDNSPFKVGDYIYNITGMIKVDQIKLNYYNNLEFIYIGLKYKRIKGVVSRTKDKALYKMINDLHLLKNN